MSSFAFVTYQQKILLLLRDPDDSYGDHWGWIGGGTEKGETNEQTLVRELKEEANIDVENLNFLYEFESRSNPGNFHHIYHVPLTDLQADKVKLGNEGQRLDFFSIGQIPELQSISGIQDAIANKRALLEDLINIKT